MAMRSFVSETALEEKRRRRQEEWEKTRGEDDPLGETANLASFRSNYYYETFPT